MDLNVPPEGAADTETNPSTENSAQYIWVSIACSD